jgi:hypothetical protein
VSPITTDDLRMKDSVSQTFPRVGTLKYISAYHTTPNQTFSVKIHIRHVGYAEKNCSCFRIEALCCVIVQMVLYFRPSICNTVLKFCSRPISSGRSLNHYILVGTAFVKVVSVAVRPSADTSIQNEIWLYTKSSIHLWTVDRRWRLQVCCSTVILGVCDLVRVFYFLCYKSMKTNGDRLKRLMWSAL